MGYSGCQKYVPFGVLQTKAVVLTLSAALTYDNRYIFFFNKKRWTFAIDGSGNVLWHGLASLPIGNMQPSKRSGMFARGTGFSQKRIGSKEAAAIAAQTGSAVA